MASLQDKAIRFGSIVTLVHHSDLRKMVISDGYVDTTLHLMKPRKTSSQSQVRGLFVILPQMTNEVKVPLRSFACPSFGTAFATVMPDSFRKRI